MKENQMAKPTGQVVRNNDKRILRRIYVTNEEYQTLFNAAWHKRKFTPDVLDGNQLIAEYCIAHAEKDLGKGE
jgi:hypothetical protein